MCMAQYDRKWMQQQKQTGCGLYFKILVEYFHSQIETYSDQYFIYFFSIGIEWHMCF